MQDPRQDYWHALGRADRTAALEAVKQLRELGASPLSIVERVIVPAQARAGELWLDGHWTREQEEAAASINEGLVHWLCSFAAAPAPGASRVLVACLGEARHAVPALALVEGLTVAGLRADYAGAAPDPDHLLERVRAQRPRAVFLSAVLTSSLAAHKPLLLALRETGVPVVVSGPAFGGDEARARSLGATAYAETVEDAVRLLDELPARLPVDDIPPPPPSPADVEAQWILHYHHEITPYVVRALAARHVTASPETPPAAGAEPGWWSELGWYVDHLLGCLASSLVTGDETIVIEVRAWLTRVLRARGADASLLEDLWGVVAEPLRSLPLARALLTASSADGHAVVELVPSEPVVPGPRARARPGRPQVSPAER